MSKVCTKIGYLTIFRPHHLTAEGLFETVNNSLRFLRVKTLDGDSDNVDNGAVDPGVVSQITNPINSNKKLVGMGTDGASSNIAAKGLNGLVEQKLPWIFWMWCLAHRLELAIKDALSGTVFDSIDEMLLCLYYLYEKSPKKCIELKSLCADLKECLEFDEDGIRPVRACGTRWVSHKVKAMKRVLSRYGAYTAHLTSLSEDKSVKAADRAKLKGYLKKWVNAKYVLGCAAFVDLLTPCSVFSRSMQSDNLGILAAITHLVKTLNETDKLSSKPLEQWKTYGDTLKKVQDEKGQPVYQVKSSSLRIHKLFKLFYMSNTCMLLIYWHRISRSWKKPRLSC